MLQRLTVVIVVRAGDPDAIYIGPDREAADNAYQAAANDVKNEEVFLFAQTLPLKRCTPAADRVSIEAEEKDMAALLESEKKAKAEREKIAKEAQKRAEQRKELITRLGEAETVLGESKDASARQKNAAAVNALAKELNDFDNPKPAEKATPAPAKEAKKAK